MRLVKRCRDLAILLTGFVMAFAGSNNAAAEQCDEDNTVAGGPQNEQVMRKFTKQELIDSLRRMNRRPEQVRAVSAMCYDTFQPPESVTYQCEQCGTGTTYTSSSDQGELTRQIEYGKRFLAETPYHYKIDETGLCSKCGKGKSQDITVTMDCYNCGAPFSWKLSSGSDISAMQWLALSPSAKSVDMGHAGFRQFDDAENAKAIQSVAQYIHEHVYCLKCREKLPL